jgi:hypothetical protein
VSDADLDFYRKCIASNRSQLARGKRLRYTKADLSLEEILLEEVERLRRAVSQCNGKEEKDDA